MTAPEEVSDRGDERLPSNGTEKQQEETTTPSGKKARAWIRYCVEYRDRWTHEVIHTRETEAFGTEHSGVDGQGHDDCLVGPAFELVTTYKIRESKETAHSVVALHTTPSYHLCIRSLAIIHALQSVVDYYPEFDLTGDNIVVHCPYPILVHHYDELTRFRENRVDQERADLCVREKDAVEHLGLLLEFLDEHVMEGVNEEKERNKRGCHTFEWMWVPRKPGTIVMEKTRENNSFTPSVVHSIEGGVFDNPPSSWHFHYWRMSYDGKYLGRDRHWVRAAKFDDEESYSDDYRFVDMDAEDEDVAENIRLGEIYWNLLHKQCMYHKGPATSFPFNEVDGLVMADIVNYYVNHESQRPSLMDTSDCRNWVSDCTCAVCKEETKGIKDLDFLYEDYNRITIESQDSLTPEQYLLCPSEMPAYVFRTRTWETFHVGNFTEPNFQEDMIDNLVMDEDRVMTLKALAKGFARVNKHGEEMGGEPWAADFVKGKGQSLIFLLHGKPGVGKTFTAECIAEFARRPLMILTCSDIGTKPKEVEANLTENFKTAKSWGAALLVDEADVFMERRSTADLDRNSLVAGFLRALEYYDGILFLTTNRVGSFDDAFISRVHVQLYYPDFTDEQRQRIWNSFVTKLAKERAGHMRVTIDAKDYIRGKEIRALKWNGREIRNAFQTAVALAEFRAEKDEENHIILTDQHLRAIVELSRDFKEYLKDLHKGDEGKRAERRYERLDM